MTRAPRSGTGGAPSHPPSGAGTWRLPPPAQSPAEDGFTWGQAAEEAGSDAPGNAWGGGEATSPASAGDSGNQTQTLGGGRRPLLAPLCPPLITTEAQDAGTYPGEMGVLGLGAAHRQHIRLCGHKRCHLSPPPAPRPPFLPGWGIARAGECSSSKRSSGSPPPASAEHHRIFLAPASCPCAIASRALREQGWEPAGVGEDA